MGLTADQLQAVIEERFKPVHLTVEDVSGGCGSNFEVTIVSEMFEGKKLLQKHKLVNSLLADEIAQMHAFKQNPYTPEEWAKKQGESS
eukprot:Clim_evm25s253 gene=Clim_evmTU25s253